MLADRAQSLPRQGQGPRLPVAVGAWWSKFYTHVHTYISKDRGISTQKGVWQILINPSKPNSTRTCPFIPFCSGFISEAVTKTSDQK